MQVCDADLFLFLHLKDWAECKSMRSLCPSSSNRCDTFNIVYNKRGGYLYVKYCFSRQDDCEVKQHGLK